MLADIEYSTLKSYSLNRLLHNDGFDQPDAYIGNINYTSEHNLNRFFDRAACNLRIYHRTQESLYYRNCRDWKDLSGLCVRDRSM